jgi:hypothetical protein
VPAWRPEGIYCIIINGVNKERSPAWQVITIT